MAIRILSSENITGNLTLHHSSNAPYIDFVENADTSDSKARITMDQIDTNNGQLIFSTEKAGTLTTALTISQSQNVDIAGNLNLSVASSFITTSAGDIYLNPASNNTTLYDGTNAQIFNVYNAGNLSIKLDSVAGTYGGVLLNQAGTNFVHGISGQGLVLSHHNIGASNAIVSGDASNPDNLYINNGGAASDWSNVIIEGNVGIGTILPAEKLTVNGNIITQGGSTNTGYDRYLKLYGNTAPATNTHRWAGLAVYNNGGNNVNELAFFTGSGDTARTEKMRLDAGGFLGIGTTDPLDQLHINNDTSNSYATLRLEGANRGGIINFYNAGYPVFQMLGEQSGNMYFATSGAFGSTTMTTRFTFSTTGAFGVGTTSFAPTVLKQLKIGDMGSGVVGEIHDAALVAGASQLILSTASGAGVVPAISLRHYSAAYGVDIWMKDTTPWNTYIDNRHPSSGFQFRNNTNNNGGEVPLMIIKGDGNVGIGTDSPNAKLDVKNNDGNASGLHIVADFNQNAGAGAQMILGYYADGTSPVGPLIYAANGMPQLINASGGINFSNDLNFSTNFTYTFRDAVGINNPNSISATVNAGYTMCVGRSNNGAGVSGSISAVGTIRASAFTTGINTTAGIGASNGDVNAAEVGPGYLNLSRDDTAAAQQIRFEKNGALSAWIQTGPSDLSIGTETVNFNVYLQSNLYLNIDTNNTYFNRNNVHIAKTTPQLYLDGRSFGNSGAVLNILGWAATYKNWCIANATSGAGTLNFRVSSAAGGNSGFATVGVISESTGAYTAVSDINKKKDFEDSEIGLKEVMELKPKLYRMKDDDEDSNKHLGFIAQEVKEVIPQAYVEEGEFIGLNERAIIAALTKAIQELKAEIEILKNK